MRQKWTLNIQEFGRIKEGRIEISPLMLFVGDNNSGKSYVMSLLWGILVLGRNYFPKEAPSLDSYRRCDEWLKNSIGIKNILVDNSTQILFVNWFNDILKQKKKELIHNIFNYSLDIGNVYISDYKRDNPIEILWVQEGSRDSSGEDYVKFQITENSHLSAAERYRMLKYLCWKLLMDNLTAPLNPLIRNKKAVGEPLYLPASRTGFMLTYKTIVEYLFDREEYRIYDDTKEEDADRSQFTLPVIRFLKELVRINIQPNSKYYEIASYLESEVLQGVIEQDTSPVRNVLFKPAGFKQDLSLHVTSSLVAELSPLVLFLKSQVSYKLMIIEEPEAHLHLKAQKNLTRAIIRLVNQGLPIWLTTHSDTMFQQINNMIKLNNQSDNLAAARKYGYSHDDFLDPQKAAAYQFEIQENGETRIETLKLHEYGFSVPTFNEPIINLSKETLEFQGMDSDVE